MYTPILMCGYAAALLLTLAGFRAVRRSAPDLHGTRYLSWFLVLGSSAVLLIAGRPWLPALISIDLANILLFVGALILYLAAAEILGQKPKLFPLLAGISLLAVPPLLWFTYAQDEPIGRLVVHGVVIGLDFAVTAGLLLREGDGALRPTTRSCAWMLSAGAALQAVWCGYGVLVQPHVSFLRPDPANVGFSYLSMLLALGIDLALLWLALTAHRLELERMAQTDVLTGLLNRRAFEQILLRELQRSQLSGETLGLMLIDLDHFKRINDSLGHFAGDEVLRRTALALREGTRPSDVLARYGGEEFVVLLRHVGMDETETTAERIRMRIEDLSGLPGNVRLTASVGVAISWPGETASDLLRRSDEAMYRSKREGRNLVRIDQRTSSEPAIAG